MNRKILSVFIIGVIVVSLLLSAIGGRYTLNYAKAAYAPRNTGGNVSIYASPGSLSQSGHITVFITVTNTNSFGGGDYTDILVTNDYGVSFSTSNVPAGETKTFTGSMYVSGEQIGEPLIFYVSWYDRGSSQQYTSDLTLTIPRGGTVYLKLTRTSSRKSAAPGEVIVLTYTLVNTGTVTLNEIKLVDKEIAGSASMLEPFSLASGQSISYEYNYIMGNITVASKPTASFIPEGSDTALSAAASKLTIGLENPKLSKEISQGVPTPEGIPFTMYFTNNGNKRLSNLTVTDELDNKITEPFNLAVGETKYLEYTVPNPSQIRNIIFKITGTDENGGAFRDNTQSFTVRPYIDPNLLGLDFAVQVRSQLDNDYTIGLTFTVQNTGRVDYSDITVSEQSLGYEIHRIDKLTPEDGTVTFDENINLDSERELVFILNASDTSGNVHVYTVHINAEYYDPNAVFPNDPPSDPNINVDEPGISENIDGLLTGIGEKIDSWFGIIGVVAVIIAIIIIVLFAVEISLRKKLKAQRQKQRQRRVN